MIPADVEKFIARRFEVTRHGLNLAVDCNYFHAFKGKKLPAAPAP